MRQLTVWALVLAAATAVQAQSLQEEPTRTPRPDEPPPRAPANSAKDFVRFAFNFYDQSDQGGNPNLDETMTVLEPQILISGALSERWTGSLKLQSDVISAASVEKGTRFPPGTQTGASGDKYFGVDAGAFYAWSDRTTVGGGISGSVEYDYMSLGAYAKWSHDTADRNNTFVARFSAYFDTLALILFDGSEPGSDNRTSLSFGLGWTRILGPRSVATFNWDLTSQSGFLSTPYNSVIAAGTEVPEVLPDSRFRNAFHVRVRHLLFDDVAIEPGVGAYFDDWGASAINVEFNVWLEVVPGRLLVRPGYRWHSQTEVDDFLPTSATSIPEFRTQDSDLADFNSHTVGLKLIFPHAPFLGDLDEVELGFDYTLRSDSLDAFSITIGYQWRY